MLGRLAAVQILAHDFPRLISWLREIPFFSENLSMDRTQLKPVAALRQPGGGSERPLLPPHARALQP